MKLTTVIRIAEEMKGAVKKELNLIFDEIENMSPEPSFLETETGFEYVTFSGKGIYDFDFSREGKIIVNCDCYRQSLIDGTAFFRITMPIGIPVNQLAGKENFLVLKIESEIKFFGTIESAESSQPSRPAISGMDLEEFLKVGGEMGLVEFHKPKSTKSGMFRRVDEEPYSEEELWWLAWERFVSCRDIEYYP
ncbi:MAG: hypothetical protein KAQ87_02310 [Candidatus Pacebacteria bacterium]|nr:hypothetical protein [Candidatus Paceibacterota bacterium]